MGSIRVRILKGWVEELREGADEVTVGSIRVRILKDHLRVDPEIMAYGYSGLDPSEDTESVLFVVEQRIFLQLQWARSE